MGSLLRGGVRTAVLVLSSVFLFGLFCAPATVGKFLMVPALVLLAGIRLRNGRAGETDRARTLLRPDLCFLALAFVWTAVTVAVRHPSVAIFGVLEANVVLMVLFALAIDAIVDAGVFRPFLQMMVGFAAVEAVLSMGLQLWSRALFDERLFSFGRAANPIPAAGGYAVALLAALALLRAELPSGTLRERLAVGSAALTLVAALVWSASRGPIISVIACLALVCTWSPRRHPLLLFALAMFTWAAIASFILFEADIKGMICNYSIGRLCAQSLRLDVWEWVAAGIKAHPIFGMGFDFRFPGDRPHAHNGLAALALGGGLPFLAAFLVLCAVVSRLAAELPNTAETRFCAQAYVFAFGYMATDLPNPIGFINTHYLFLWLPIFFIASRWQQQRLAHSSADPTALASMS